MPVILKGVLGLNEVVVDWNQSANPGGNRRAPNHLRTAASTSGSLLAEPIEK
jgi:hypothetical protein